MNRVIRSARLAAIAVCGALAVSVAAASPATAETPIQLTPQEMAEATKASQTGLVGVFATPPQSQAQALAGFTSDCSSGDSCFFQGNQYDGGFKVKIDCSPTSTRTVDLWGLYGNIEGYARSLKNRCGDRRARMFNASGGQTVCVRPNFEQTFVSPSRFIQVGGPNC